MTRVSEKQVELRISNLNTHLGLTGDKRLVLDAACGAYALHMRNPDTSESNLFGPDTLRNVNTFVMGMSEGVNLKEGGR